MTIWKPDLEGRSGPLYIAIAEAIAEDIRSGRLPAGTRLPTHRDLAEHLGVTVGTVSRGYAEAARRGYLSGEVGRGTFARAPGPVPRPSPPAPLRTADGQTSPYIDLSANYPPPQPLDEEGAALRATLEGLIDLPDLARLLAYQPDAGAFPHRAAGATWLRRVGIDALPEHLLLCSGSQHAMTAVFTTLVKPGELVLTESLTYSGMKALANLLHLRLQGVAMDGEGLLPEALEAACQSGRVRALYCVPTLQNPTSSIMSEERRAEVAAICRAHDVAIVEDDIHAMLPERPLRPLSSFAPELSYYISSTSKCLAPGLRVGYLLAPAAMVAPLAAAIRTITWMAAPLMAEIATRWIEDGTADRLLQARRAEAAARQRLAKTLLGRWEYSAHPYGYHLWLLLPEPWRSESFAAEARARGVLVTPAEAFIVGRESTPHAVRICLGGARDRAELERALHRIAETLEAPPSARLAFV